MQESGILAIVHVQEKYSVHMYMYMNDVILISYPVWPVLLVPGHLCRTVREDKLTGKNNLALLIVSMTT